MDGLLLVGTHVCALFGRGGGREAAAAEQRRGGGDAAVSTHARTHVWSRDETSNYICIQSVLHKQTHQAQPTKGVLVAREIRNFRKESWAATFNCVPNQQYICTVRTVNNLPFNEMLLFQPFCNIAIEWAIFISLTYRLFWIRVKHNFVIQAKWNSIVQKQLDKQMYKTLNSNAQSIIAF